MSDDRRRLLNRAVRDYCPGGNETLDAVELFHKISDRHSAHTEAGKISRLAETKINDIANAMREQAREWQKEETEKDYSMNIKITTSANEIAIVPDQSEESIRKAMHQLGYSGFSKDPNLRFYYRAPGGNENWVGCTVEPTDEPIHDATTGGAHDRKETMKDSEINEFTYGYARQASQPKWFDRSNPLHFCETSGSSPFSEWAGFYSEKQALAWVNEHRDNHQGFIDSFERVADKYYAVDDLDYSEKEDTCEVVATPKAGAEPATIGELVTNLLEH